MVTHNYDSLQKVWDTEHSIGPTHWIKDKRLFRELKCLKDCVILDVGAGNGHFTQFLERSNKVLAIDISVHAMKTIRKLRRQLGNNLVASAEKLPFKDHMFDVIICFDVIEHVCDAQVLPKEFNRVLKNGGILYFSVPEDQYLYSWIDTRDGHFKRYSKRESMDLFHDFHIVNLTDYGFPFMRIYYKLLPYVYSNSKENVYFLKRLIMRVISFFLFLIFHIDFLFAGNFKGCQIIGCVKKINL